MRTLGADALCVFMCLWATTVAAQASEGANEEVARKLFEAGRAAYDAGDYEEALTQFRAAHERSGRPRLLYNIGQAADRLRRNEEALEAFRAYLTAVPDAENRTSVENRVRLLARIVEEEHRQRQAEVPQPPAATTPAPPDRAATQEAEAEAVSDAPAEQPVHAAALPIAPLAVAGGGVVLVAIGGVFGAMAKSSEDDYAALPVSTRDEIDAADEALSEARTQATVANVLFGIGAAALVAGGLWFAMEWGEDSDAGDASAWAAPMLGPRVTGVAVAGRFGGERW